MKRFAQMAIMSDTTRRSNWLKTAKKIAEGKLPVTCPVCFAIWQDVHRFTHVDFDTQSGKSDFIDTCHSENITGNVSITGKK